MFILKSNARGEVLFELYDSKTALLEYLEQFERFDWCEIAEISATMTTAGNRKETLEWKRPQRGGITW